MKLCLTSITLISVFHYFYTFVHCIIIKLYCIIWIELNKGDGEKLLFLYEVFLILTYFNIF